jgi:hypothetical protein
LLGTSETCLRVFPIGAFARGDLQRVLLVSILTGFAVTGMGEVGERGARPVDVAARVYFWHRRAARASR